MAGASGPQCRRRLHRRSGRQPRCPLCLGGMACMETFAGLSRLVSADCAMHHRRAGRPRRAVLKGNRACVGLAVCHLHAAIRPQHAAAKEAPPDRGARRDDCALCSPALAARTPRNHARRCSGAARRAHGARAQGAGRLRQADGGPGTSDDGAFARPVGHVFQPRRVVAQHRRRIPFDPRGGSAGVVWLALDETWRDTNPQTFRCPLVHRRICPDFQSDPAECRGGRALALYCKHRVPSGCRRSHRHASRKGKMPNRAS